MDFKGFKSGEGDYRPIVLWSLNHQLEEDEMSWQINEMSEKGLQGFVLHPRSGLLTPYMSERWLCLLEHAIKEAQSKGLQAWLYDEDPYPSGVAGGKVVADHPEYRAQVLKVSKMAVTEQGQVSMDIPMNRIISAMAIRIENNEIVEKIDIKKHIGIIGTKWQESKCYHSYYPTCDSKALPQYRSDTEEMNYRLEWDAPEGEWQVLVFHVRQWGKYWMFNSYTDLLNPDAVKYFMETTYEPYADRFGKYFGEVIPGIFTDEPKFISAPFPWTARLPEEFEARKHYKLEEALIALSLDYSNSAQSRKDFWEVVGEMFNEAYVKQISAWCEERGISFIGHTSPEEEPGDQVTITGDIMQFMKNMDIPGTDLITYMIGDKKHPIVNLGPKLAASTARQWKSGKALCEVFGVMEWKLNLADMVWITNWLYSLGVNIVVMHAFIYSIDGYRKKDAAPSEFYQAPYWKYFREYSDYVSTLGYMLGDAEPCTNTAVIYPFDSFMSLQTIHSRESEILRDRFVYLTDFLIRKHIQFDFADYKDFLAAPVENGGIQIGKKHYSKVVLPSVSYISIEMIKKLQRLMDEEIYTAVCLEKMPAYVTEMDDSLLNELNFKKNASDVYRINGNAADGFYNEGLEKVAAACADDIQISGDGAEEVFINHSIKDGKHVYFLNNTSKEEVKLEFSLRQGNSVSVEEWNFRNKNSVKAEAEKVQKSDADDIIKEIYNVSLYPRSATFIVATNIETNIENVDNHKIYDIQAGNSRGANSDIIVKKLPLGNKWLFTTGGRNALILDKWVLDEADPVDISKIDFRLGYKVVAPGTAEKHGCTGYPTTLVYKTVVNVKGKPGRMGLVLEKSGISGDFEIYFNGTRCSSNFKTREYDCNNIEYAIDAGLLDANANSLYRIGENVITVTVRVNNPEDGLLEPLRLFGDFFVELNEGESVGAEIRTLPENYYIETGSWTYQGFPHFSGCAVYEQDVNIDDYRENCRYILTFDTRGQAAEIIVNGMNAGVAAWEPYEMDITDFIVSGTNTIAIKVASTLENLLYGVQKPSGLFGAFIIFRKIC